jgi:outer membrane protein assembly factor BamD (BamD/ComL family)
MERPASRTYRLAHAALLAVLVALPSLPSTATAQAAKPPAAKEEESPTQRLWNEAETALGKKQYKAAFDLFKKLESESEKAGLPEKAKAAIAFRQATCLYLLAGQSKKAEDWAKVEGALKAFLTKFPRGTEDMLEASNNMRGVVRLSLIEVYANQSKWDAALADLDALRRPSPEIRGEDRVLAFVLTAKVLEEKAKGQSEPELKLALGQAMNLLKQVIATGIGTNESREAANKLVEVYTKLGMVKDAELLRAEIEAKGGGSPTEMVRANVQRLEIGDARFQAAEETTDPKARDALYRQALASYQGTLRRAALARTLGQAVESKQAEVDQLNRLYAKPDANQQDIINKAKEEVEGFRKIQAEFLANKDYDAVIAYRIGLCLLELGRPWESFVAFRDIFQNNPGFEKISGAYYYYIDALRRIGRNEEARKVSRDFLTKYPDAPEVAAIAVGLGEISMEQEEYDQAIEQFKWAKANVKGLDISAQQEIDFGIIRALFSNVDWAKSRAALDEFLTKYPKSPARDSALYMHGLTWFFEGRYRETKASLEKYMAEFPNGQYQADVLYRQGIVALNVQGPDEAIAIARQWLSKHSSSKADNIVAQIPELHVLIGDAHTKKADLEGRKAADAEYKARVTAAPGPKAQHLKAKAEAEAAKEVQVQSSIEAYLLAVRAAKANPPVLDFAIGELNKLLTGRGDQVRLRAIYQELYDWDNQAPKALSYLYEVIKATEKMGDGAEFRVRTEAAQTRFGQLLATARAKVDSLDRTGKVNTPEFAQAKAEVAKLSEDLAKELDVVEQDRQKSIQAARQEALGILGKAIKSGINDRRQEGAERLIGFLAEKLARRVKRVRPGQEPAPGAYTAKQAEADLEATLGVTASTGSLIAQARLLYGKATLALLARDNAGAEAYWRRIADLYKAEELSPGILGTVGDYLASRKDPKAEAYFSYISEHHRASDYADFGFAGLAELRLSQGKAKESLVLADEATKMGITLSKEKDIRFTRARALLELGQFDEAKKEFTEISAVREWRGEITSGCLYHLALIEEKQGRAQEAIVLHQRNILAWKKHEKWVAKSYLRAGELLTKLGQRDAARETYQEMLTKERVKETPEAQEARTRLTQI